MAQRVHYLLDKVPSIHNDATPHRRTPTRNRHPSLPGRANALRSHRAFTLIELMIVVAIVGILAVLGIVGYRKLILSAHTSEATHMVQAIRVAEEAYHAETQVYVSTSSDGITGTFPSLAPGAFVTAWSTPAPPGAGQCGPYPLPGAPACFGLIPVHVDGPVAYGYATVAGSAGTASLAVALPAPASVSLSGPPGTSPTDWYWITATGNPAGYASGANMSYVVGNSFSNDLFVQDQ